MIVNSKVVQPGKKKQSAISHVTSTLLSLSLLIEPSLSLSLPLRLLYCRIIVQDQLFLLFLC